MEVSSTILVPHSPFTRFGVRQESERLCATSACCGARMEIEYDTYKCLLCFSVFPMKIWINSERLGVHIDCTFVDNERLTKWLEAWLGVEVEVEVEVEVDLYA